MPMNRRRFIAGAAAALSLRAAPVKPNVVLIYCDDLGYGDLGCYGSKLRTPNLDRMASEGMRFTDFYSASPVCSPSRAALLTGRYPTRVGVPRVLFPYDTAGMDRSEVTTADMLKGSGYRSLCVGKWHLGQAPDYVPTKRGFDRYFGIPYSNDMNPRILMRDAETIEQEMPLDTITPRYTEQAVQFVRESKGQPFFLYFAHTYPHIPLGASEKFRGKSPLGLYGDVIEELDWSVGEVLRTLKETGVDRDTLVLFSSDNGPWFQGSPGRLRGRKGGTNEGGIRVPLLARWPGRIPAGKVTAAVGSTIDLLPTVAHMTGATLPEKPLDGVNLWPVLSGAKAEMERPAPLLAFDGWNLQCARWGQWKLHLSRYNSFAFSPPPAGGRQNRVLGSPELYNLSLDPEESYDVAERHPDVVKDIRQRVESMLPGFPEPVQKAWAEAQGRPASQRPAGALAAEK